MSKKNYRFIIVSNPMASEYWISDTWQSNKCVGTFSYLDTNCRSCAFQDAIRECKKLNKLLPDTSNIEVIGDLRETLHNDYFELNKSINDLKNDLNNNDNRVFDLVNNMDNKRLLTRIDELNNMINEISWDLNAIKRNKADNSYFYDSREELRKCYLIERDVLNWVVYNLKDDERNYNYNKNYDGL